MSFIKHSHSARNHPPRPAKAQRSCGSRGAPRSLWTRAESPSASAAEFGKWAGFVWNGACMLTLLFRGRLELHRIAGIVRYGEWWYGMSWLIEVRYVTLRR